MPPSIAPQAGASQARQGSNSDYAELKRLVKERGLFEPQPVYYTYKFLLTGCIVAAGATLLFVIRDFRLQLLNAVFWGFAFTQVFGLGHDVGHRQVFRRRRWTELSSLVLAVVTGISLSWWTQRHNQHHAFPNHVGADPDMETPFFSFREDEVGRRQGLQGFIARHQVYFFFLAQPLLAVVFRIWSARSLLQGRARHPWAEGALVAVHYPLYFGLLLSRLSIAQMLLFVVVHQATLGTYLATLIAPNHKGMPTIDEESSLDYLRRQVLTARNVRAHPVTDFWYVGLNYQIEHHLFPSIPRNRLTEVQKLVRDFCASHSIPYCETGVVQSYREIARGLVEVSASVSREGTRTPSTH